MTGELSKYFPLRKGRTHEAFGANAKSMAFALAGQLRGPVLWIREAWLTDQINPAGFADYVDPAQVLVVKGKEQSDVLAAAEESLRSGAVVLTVIELSKPIGLTAGRRLQLAAEVGKSTGLCLIADGMGSNAAETRWQCEPLFDQSDSTLQRWQLKKNKSGTLTGWDVRWDAKTHRIIVVSKAGE
ncbi:MAG: ImuA family protein [Cognatishimia sp.]